MSTCDGNRLRLYINGVEDANPPINLDGTLVHTANRMFIGKDLIEHGPDAVLDEVAVCSRALPADRVGAHYQTGSRLSGRLGVEKRGPRGDPRWATELFRASGTGGIKVYQAGTSNLLGAYSATTDANGAFSVGLAGIGPGTYDLVVKGSDTLSNRKAGVSLPSAGEVDLAMLLVGDASGDDAVNGLDVSYMIPSFWKCTGDTAFRPYADTNRDGCTNGLDVSALIPNFWKWGPINVAGLGPAEAGSLSRTPTSPSPTRTSTPTRTPTATSTPSATLVPTKTATPALPTPTTTTKAPPTPVPGASATSRRSDREPGWHGSLQG